MSDSVDIVMSSLDTVDKFVVLSGSARAKVNTIRNQLQTWLSLEDGHSAFIPLLSDEELSVQ